MLKRIVLLASFAVALTLAPSAQAASIKVEVGYGGVDGCRVDDERISYRFFAQGKVTFDGISPPKRIRAAYQLVDKDTGWTIASRIMNLNKSAGYSKKSKRFVVTAGHTITERVKFTYRALGRNRSFWKKSKQVMPTKEELEASGVPYCA